MKYRISKVSPGPGRFTDLIVTHISAVNSPANKTPFLIVKGTNEMSLTEQDRKDLQAQGLSPQAIEKAVANLPESEKAPATKGFMSVLKSLFGTEVKPEPKPEPLTLEAIEKSITKIVDQKLASVSKTEQTPATEETKTPEQELTEIQKEIEAEKAGISKEDDLNEKLKKAREELAEIKKMRMPGNSTDKANQNKPGLSSETIAKAQIEDIFKGTNLS